MAVQRSVQDSWLIFKNCLIQAQEQSIPVNRKPIKGGRRPASMNRGPHKTLTLKGNIWEVEAASDGIQRLSKHAGVMGSRKPKLTWSCFLVEAVKGNKEGLYKYFRSKGKSGYMDEWSRGPSDKDMKNAEVFNAFLHCLNWLDQSS